MRLRPCSPEPGATAKRCSVDPLGAEAKRRSAAPPGAEAQRRSAVPRGATAKRRNVDPLDASKYILVARSALEGGIFDAE